jgi:hypothetical protein
LNGPLCLDVADSGVDVFGNNISSVQQATGHVLSLPGVALDHLVVALETSDSHLGNRVGLMEGYSSSALIFANYRKLTLVGRDDGCVGSKREVDSGERDQIGLELVQIDVQGTVESKRSGDGRHNLSNETIEIGEGRRSDAKVSSTDVVDTVVSSVIAIILTLRCQP